MDWRMIATIGLAVLGLALMGMGSRTGAPLTKAECRSFDHNKDGAVGLNDTSYFADRVKVEKARAERSLDYNAVSCAHLD